MAASDDDKGAKPEKGVEDAAKDASMAEAEVDAAATGDAEMASATSSHNNSTYADVNPTGTGGAKAGGPQKKSGPGRRGSTSTPKTPSDNNNRKRQSMSQGAIAATTPGDTPGTVVHSPAPAQDLHPYARSAVIEVLYIPAQAVGKTTATIQEASSNDPWYWSEDSSLCSTTSNSSTGEDNEENNDDDNDDDNAGGGSKKRKDAPKDNDGDVAMEDAKEAKAATQESNKETSPNSKAKEHHHHHHHHHHHQNAASVRLCDIIDRAPVLNEDGTEATNAAGQPQAWRYYVHYRDFNRRMDEWIGMDRIVSPPSVGNAKARALKREEEKQKKKQQRLEEKQRAEQQKKEQKMLGDLDVTAPRSSRRRSTGATPGASGSLSPAVGGASGGGVAGAAGGAPADAAGRKTRLRRKSNVAGEDDAATVVAGNQDEDATDEKDPVGIKEILTLPTGTSNMATTIVGEHVVATVAAQEIDEHEGLDEASLREHEEITKVKNVSFIELGRHQMETWYFSPIPKELLSARGYIEVLCVCEFTFRMFARKSELQRFQQRSLRPQDRHPPGNEIYRKGNLSSMYIQCNMNTRLCSLHFLVC